MGEKHYAMPELDRNETISQLYEEYYDRLFLACYRVCGFRSELLSAVEECVQNVFHTALKKYPDLIGHPDIEGWLFRCAANKMNNVLKTYNTRNKLHAYSTDEVETMELSDPHDSFRELEEQEALASTLYRIYELLMEKEIDIFNQYFLEGNALEQIAKNIGKTESSVKNTIYRIRKRLKKSFFQNTIYLLLGATFELLNK